jgi:hypothetical protein
MFFAALFTTACNRQIVQLPSPESLVIFPPPPAETRIQFLTQISSSDDLKGQRGAFHRYVFGEEKTKSIIKPYGVTVRQNKVYICDTGIAGLVILDLELGTFDYFIPDGKGQLQLPINCDIDEEGKIYIADANRQQIVIFDRNLQYLHAFGEEENFKPTDVVVSEGKIWVANVQGHAIHVFNQESYDSLQIIPGSEPGEDGFIRQPTNIFIHENELLVSDFGDFNIKRFSLQGEFLGAIGGPGNAPGFFTRPKGLSRDQAGNLFVVDAAFENVQIFNPGGKVLMHFGGAFGGPGAMYLPAAVEISTENLSFFESYVDPDFELKYLVYVTNQYGPAKLNIYGFVEMKNRGSNM